MSWITVLWLAGFNLQEYYNSTPYQQAVMQVLAEQKVRYDTIMAGADPDKKRSSKRPRRR